MKIPSHISTYFKSLILALAFLAASASAATWAPPAADPPHGNLSAPLTAATHEQSKTGELHLTPGGFTSTIGVVDNLVSSSYISLATPADALRGFTGKAHAQKFCLDTNNTPADLTDDDCRTAWGAGPSSCIANGTYEWSNGSSSGRDCSATATSQSVAAGGSYTLQDAAGGVTGSLQLNCSNGTITQSNWVCSAINGECGSAHNPSGFVSSYPTSNHCSAGTYRSKDTRGDDGRYDWECESTGTGGRAQCYVNSSAACGTMHGETLTSPPSSRGNDMCAVGTASAVTTTSTAYTWTCTGGGTGNVASCSANRAPQQCPATTYQATTYPSTCGSFSLPALNYGASESVSKSPQTCVSTRGGTCCTVDTSCSASGARSSLDTSCRWPQSSGETPC